MWYAMLGLIKHTVNGEETCHDWSDGHETYDYTVTQHKIEQWQHGPTTCAKFQQLNKKGCEGCTHNGKVTSPILLGTITPVTKQIVEVDEETAELVETPIFPPSIAENYAWRNGVLNTYVKDEEGVRREFPIADFLFYPKSYHSSHMAGGEKELKSSWVLRVKDGSFRDFTVDGGTVGVGGRDLFLALGRQGLMARSGAKKHMERYVSDWFTKIRQDSEEVKAFATFGWHDQDFLIGTDLYMSTGEVRRVRVHGDASKYEMHFTNTGSLGDWTSGINTLYNRPGHQQFQWMLGVGFGAPLVKLLGMGMAGCAVHGYSSETGFGKSTAGKLALGMYGNPDRLALTKQQVTTKGLFAFCGVMNSLPILLDEITNAKGFELSEMVYTFSQGTGRVGAQSDGSLRNNVYEWATLLSSTANRSLHDALTANNADSRPEIARAFEYRFERQDTQLGKLEADVIVPSIMRNSGVAGRAYMGYVVTHRDAVEKMLVSTQAMLTTRLMATSDERYWIAAAATIIVGSMIARKLGLITYDVTALSKWAMDQFRRMRGQVKDNTPELTEHFGSMMNELSPSFLVTNTEGDMRSGGNRAVVLHPPRGELTGRVVNDTNTLFMPVSTARKWCDANRVDYRQMMESLIEKGWAQHSTSPMSLGKGTADYATSPCRCILVNLEQVGCRLSEVDGETRLSLVR